MKRVVGLLVMCTSLCLAQMSMSVDQLIAFVKSSIELHHEDKQVAAYLKRIKLRNRLSEDAIIELKSMGAGAKTAEALDELKQASAGLPEPGAPKPKPAGPPPMAPPPQEEQKRALEEAREYAMAYSKNLPNFICTQVTRRYIDPSGLEFWQQQDVITTKLSYFEQKEDYKVVMVNNRVTDNLKYDQVGGATSSGEFGSMLKELFAPETQADFKWDRWGKLRGRIVHVFTYKVEQARSRWSINYDHKMEIIAGYTGLIYVDRDSPVVERITLNAQDIPVSFPIQQASTVLDYDTAEISGQPFILPLRAEVRMREGKMLSKNEVEFRMYRKFGAEATITFTPDSLPATQTVEEPVKKQ
jgi:hypothetical protein